MSDENEPENQNFPLRQIIFIIVVLSAPFIGNVVTQAALYYTGHVLLWNVDQQRKLLIPALALLWAILLVAYSRRAASQHQSSFYRRHIFSVAGTAIFLLALSISVNDWRPVREAYFGFALVGAGLMTYGCVLSVKNNKDPKSIDKKISAALLAVVSLLPVFVLWKYVSGASSFF